MGHRAKASEPTMRKPLRQNGGAQCSTALRARVDRSPLHCPWADGTVERRRLPAQPANAGGAKAPGVTAGETAMVLGYMAWPLVGSGTPRQRRVRILDGTAGGRCLVEQKGRQRRSNVHWPRAVEATYPRTAAGVGASPPSQIGGASRQDRCEAGGILVRAQAPRLPQRWNRGSERRPQECREAALEMPGCAGSCIARPATQQSTRGPGSPRCAPINRAMTMFRPKRRLSLPEYAKEQGRLSDYEVFVAEVVEAHESGRLRLVQLRDFSGIQLPGVEV